MQKLLNYKKRLHKTITETVTKNDATRRIEIHLNSVAIKHKIMNLYIQIWTVQFGSCEEQILGFLAVNIFPSQVHLIF